MENTDFEALKKEFPDWDELSFEAIKKGGTFIHGRKAGQIRYISPEPDSKTYQTARRVARTRSGAGQRSASSRRVPGQANSCRASVYVRSSLPRCQLGREPANSFSENS